MKHIIFTFLFFLFSISFYSQVNPNEVYVSGYNKSNGTYVEPHYRTSPNTTVNDNFSTIGNTNPHTGKAGWISRDNYPVYKTPSTTLNTIREPFYIPEYEGENEKQRKISERNMFPNGCSYDYDYKTFNDSRYTQSENEYLRQLLFNIYNSKAEDDLLNEIKFRDLFNNKKAELDNHYEANSNESISNYEQIQNSNIIDSVNNSKIQKENVSKPSLIENKSMIIDESPNRNDPPFGKIFVIIVILYFSYELLKALK